MTSERTAAAPPRRWPIFQSFAGWRFSDLGPDALAGLTLAAIAVPEQMATARLAGLPAEIGFLALFAGAVGFAAFGGSRLLSVGADSTIAPIFAGALAALAAAGSSHYAADAAMLALLVGLLLTFAGLLRLGFVADLLSIPVTTGFLVGIAGHIVVSQLPGLLGLPAPGGHLIEQVAALAAGLGDARLLSLALGLGVLAIMLACERINPRLPGALIGVGIATALVVAFGLESRGVSTLGVLAGAMPRVVVPAVGLDDLQAVALLALIVAIIVMMQTAATTRSFISDPVHGPDVNRDFVGVGAANLLAGLVAAFPVNASPPRTAVVAETGGVSQLGALVCAGLALALSAFGADLIAHVPHAALAGVLLFVAQRIVRVPTIVEVWSRSRLEFVLIAATALAILLAPIQQGVGIGIILSLMHGVWTTTRASTVTFERIAGTSIWWPADALHRGETVPGVSVVGLQAPLSFLNAYAFQEAIERLPRQGTRLIVIEANAIVEVDYTGAKILSEAVRRLRAGGVDVAFARLESVRAQQSFARQGLEALIGRDHVFHSVEEAVRALSRTQSETPA
jgi:sulfate permease, SulP family